MIENHGDEETICFPRLGGRQSPLSSRGSDVQGRHPTLPRRRVVAPVGSSWPRRYLGGQRRHVSSCQTISSILLSERGRRRSTPQEKKEEEEDNCKGVENSVLEETRTEQAPIPYQEGGILPLLASLFSWHRGAWANRQAGIFRAHH